MPVLLAMAVWNFVDHAPIASRRAADALTVEVTGHRWWWEIRYRAAAARA